MVKNLPEVQETQVRSLGWEIRQIMYAIMECMEFKKAQLGTSLVVQWLQFCTSNAGDMGSIPG